jgi:competence protein ComEA
MRHIRQIVASLSIGLPLLVWGVAGVSTPVAAASSTATAAHFAEAASLFQADQYASMPEGPGKAQTIATCTKCHSITNVTGQHKSEDEWTATITKMVGYGASGSDDDFQAILAYVVKYYGATPPADAPPATPPAPAPAPPPAQ